MDRFPSIALLLCVAIVWLELVDTNKISQSVRWPSDDEEVARLGPDATILRDFCLTARKDVHALIDETGHPDAGRLFHLFARRDDTPEGPVLQYPRGQKSHCELSRDFYAATMRRVKRNNWQDLLGRLCEGADQLRTKIDQDLRQFVGVASNDFVFAMRRLQSYRCLTLDSLYNLEVNCSRFYDPEPERRPACYKGPFVKKRGHSGQMRDMLTSPST